MLLFQDPQRVFSNNIVVRFHPGLEIDGDEIITIVCRYPPPIAPPPAGLPAAIQIPEVPASILAPPLKGIQILFIICAIMFLTLLLLGLGVSYYCLRRRPIIVQRLPYSVGTGSDITKLSGDSLANLPVFGGVKIPRAHAMVHAHQSATSSETAHASDTLPSDYPSESQSEIEELDVRSLPISSAGSYDTRNFVQNISDYYIEQYNHVNEIHEREPPQDFNVQFKLTKAPSPPVSSITTSDNESVDVALYEKNNLSTIMETQEDMESISVAPFDIIEDVVDVHEQHLSESYLVDKSNYEDKRVIETSDLPSWQTNQTHQELYQHDSTQNIDYAHPMNITRHEVDDIQTRRITEKQTTENVEKFRKIITDYKTAPDHQWNVDIKPGRDPKTAWENFSDATSTSSFAHPYTLTKYEDSTEYLQGKSIELNSYLTFYSPTLFRF